MSTASSGQTSKHASNKEKILAAASALFLQGGAAALSVRAIAKQAGLSTIGIYSHFDGKQGILDTLYIEGFEMVSAVLDVPEEGEDPVGALLRASGDYLDLAERNAAHYRLIFGERDDNYQPSDAAQEVGARAFERLTETVARALPRTASRAEQQDVAVQVWSLLHGSVVLRNHAVSQLVDMREWKSRAIDAVAAILQSQRLIA